MRGRKPTPTALKVIAGNPGKRPLPKHEPKYEVGEPDMPARLPKDAQAVWRTEAPEMVRKGVLTTVMGSVFSRYCILKAIVLRQAAEIEKTGDIICVNGQKIPNPCFSVFFRASEQLGRAEAELGATPSSATRVKVEPPKEESKLASFARKRG